MGRRRSETGMSLVELCVGSVLLLLVVWACYSVFSSSTRYYERVSVKSDMQRTAVQAISKLHQELQEANEYAIEIPASDSVLFLSPRDLGGNFSTGPDGQPVWSSAVCVRSESVGDTGRLLLQRDSIVPRPDAVHPSDLTPARDLAYFLSSTTTRDRILARHVNRFEVQKTGTAENALQILVEVVRDPGGREFKLEFETFISPKN